MSAKKLHRSESTLGTRIRAGREDKRWTRSELARRIGLRASELSRYESGAVEPKVSALQRLATALDLSLDVLLSGQPRLPPPTGEGEAIRVFRRLQELDIPGCIDTFEEIIVRAEGTVLGREEGRGTLAGRLTLCRNEHGWNQSELASRLQLDPSELSCYETAKRVPKGPILLRLREALDVTIDYLVTGRSAEPEPVSSPVVLQLMRRVHALGQLPNLVRSLRQVVDGAFALRDSPQHGPAPIPNGARLLLDLGRCAGFEDVDGGGEAGAPESEPESEEEA